MKKINVAVSVIKHENKYLLTQRYSPELPATHLKWQLPGGGVEKEESIEEACLRETLEETGLQVKIIKKSPLNVENTYKGVVYKLHAFLCEVESGTIDIEGDPETNDAKWFGIDEIRRLETLEDTYEIVKSF